MYYVYQLLLGNRGACVNPFEHKVNYSGVLEKGGIVLRQRTADGAPCNTLKTRLSLFHGINKLPKGIVDGQLRLIVDHLPEGA